MSLNQAFETFPEIETKNLLLRRIKQSDSGDLFNILSDHQVVKYYDDGAFANVSQAAEQIMSWEDGYKSKGCIRWGISKRDQKKFIGSCGFYGFHYWYKRASLGYELSRNDWRQGIMTEAISAIVDYGFDELELNRIDAVIMPENIASVKLLEKIGFQREGLLAEYEKWGSKGFVD